MSAVLVINGPNLNLLGQREAGIYGKVSLQNISDNLAKMAKDRNINIEFLQSNHEGEIVDAIQKAKGKFDAILINPAAFTHTSVAIRDAFLATDIPFVEVHLSNISARESFRHHSFLSDIARGTIAGFGEQSYYLGLQALFQVLSSK
ncbi:MAG: type II 3-dehydroquinate dehydratase [bacterium]